MPNDTALSLYVGGYDESEWSVSPKDEINIKKTQSTLKQTFVIKSVNEVLQSEFSAFKRETKSKILKTITLYDIALHSPRFEFSAKAAEANGALALLASEDTSFQKSKMNSIFKDLQLSYEVASITEEASVGLMATLIQLKKACGMSVTLTY